MVLRTICHRAAKTTAIFRFRFCGQFHFQVKRRATMISTPNFPSHNCERAFLSVKFGKYSLMAQHFRAIIRFSRIFTILPFCPISFRRLRAIPFKLKFCTSANNIFAVRRGRAGCISCVVYLSPSVELSAVSQPYRQLPFQSAWV